MKRRPSFSLKQEWLIERIVRRKLKEKKEEKRPAEEEVITFSPVVHEPQRRVSFLVEEAPPDDNYPQGSLVFHDGFLWYKGSSGWVRGVRVTVSSTFPSPAYAGDICYRSDEQQLYVYNGTGWQREASIKSGTSFPSSPQSGDIFFKTDENQFYIRDGSVWKREVKVTIATSFPSSPINGDICYRSDEKQFYVYDGTNWLREASIKSGTSFPSSPQADDIFFRTDENQFYIRDGSNWKREGKVTIATSFPSSPQVGDICYRSDEGKFYVYNGSTWLVESAGGGGGVGFGTSFPSSPTDGQLFYRTDLKRLFAYRSATSSWVAQEAMQTSAPASPVTGEFWLEDVNFRTAVRGSSATRYLGFLVTSTPDANTVYGSSGTLTGGALPANIRPRFMVGITGGGRTLDTSHAIGCHRPSGVVLVNSTTDYGSDYFVQLSGKTFMQPVERDKTVSSGNNDIVKAEHPIFYVECLNYRVLSSETSQVDFIGHFANRGIYLNGTPALSTLRLAFNIYVRGQASFTYRFAYQFIVIDLSTGSSVATTTETNFDLTTNASGYGVAGYSSGGLINSSGNRELMVILRLKRRRSAEAVGNRPDDCFVAASMVVYNWNS